MKKILFLHIFIFFFIFFISCVITFITYSNKNFMATSNKYHSSNEEYSWPLPDNTFISSFFGERISPQAGASTYHSGIDIPAKQGTPIFSANSGYVTYLGFNGANGYTLKIQNKNVIFSYSHISPNFIVNIGDFIVKGEHIADVGPKYIENIHNNPYSDSTGNQTNGATTGTHLHFSINIDNKYIDPLSIFQKIENY